METLENHNLREFWCHQCRFKFTMELLTECIECTKCKSDMIEEIEENEVQLQNFKPFQLSQQQQMLNQQQFSNSNINQAQQFQQQQQQQQQQHQPQPQQMFSSNNYNGNNSNNIQQNSGLGGFNLFSNIFPNFLQNNNNINANNNINNNNNNNNNNRRNNSNPNTLIQITNFNFSRPSLNQLFSSMFPNSPGFGFGFDDNIDNIIHYLMMNDPNIYGTPPASEESINNLKEIKIEVNNNNANEPQEIHECCVCKEEFKSEEIVKQMPCQHLFHKDCLLPWLKQHNSCPICRFELPTDNPDYEQRKNNQQQSQNNNNNRNQQNQQNNNNNNNQQNQQNNSNQTNGSNNI